VPRLPLKIGLLALLAPVLQSAAAPAPAAECAGVQILSEQRGPTWREPIRIHVDRAYRIFRALVAADRGSRGFMEMPLRGVGNDDGALLHEIVHIYAPNDNRFLAEGLAVYLHHKLAGNAAFPNFGKPLDAEARGRLGHIESLDRLNAVRAPRSLGTVLSEESAYGVAPFRRLYESGAYEAAYGKSLAAPENEWRSVLLRGN
jgi:hypothetical protein